MEKKEKSKQTHFMWRKEEKEEERREVRTGGMGNHVREKENVVS